MLVLVYHMYSIVAFLFRTKYIFCDVNCAVFFSIKLLNTGRETTFHPATKVSIVF
uniref:Uncharacterized protein n=1 Tax=Setaria italica TaxID=4555 RepID=K3XTJ6_SETIT